MISLASLPYLVLPSVTSAIWRLPNKDHVANSSDFSVPLADLQPVAHYCLNPFEYETLDCISQKYFVLITHSL